MVVGESTATTLIGAGALLAGSAALFTVLKEIGAACLAGWASSSGARTQG